MNKKNLLNVTLWATLALFAISCNTKSNYANKSRGTGIEFNDRDQRGQRVNTNYKEQEPPVGTVFIEGGTFTMGRVQDDVMHDWNNSPTQQHVQSFYMDETEVTNLMYLEYLEWTKRMYDPKDKNYEDIYKGILPDTLVWRNRLGFNEVMTNNYLRHPAYRNYPVVGVSWIQAVEFSEWRTNMVAERILREQGRISEDADLQSGPGNNFDRDTYLTAPSQVYGGNEEVSLGGKESQRRIQQMDNEAGKRSSARSKKSSKDDGDTEGGEESTDIASEGEGGEAGGAASSGRRFTQLDSGILPPKFRLPTEVEWEYAALGLRELRSYNIYRGRKKYPWKGQYTRSGTKNKLGDQLANFKQGSGDYGGIAGWSDDKADITAEVMSFTPNDYGLYDMAGNVAEWVADVYRPIVDDEFNDFNYYRGNVYTKNAISSDGTVVVLGASEMVYDTLSNGKVIARTLPGQIKQVPIDEDETYLRTNFDESDNRNYRDGDKQSSRYYEAFEEIDGDPTKDMYNSPTHSVTTEDGELKRQYDTSTKRRTQVDDKARVYKGGSWKDRAYWLDPAQRRYFPQDMATDYIGFRNAVSRVGSKSSGPRRPTN